MQYQHFAPQAGNTRYSFGNSGAAQSFFGGGGVYNQQGFPQQNGGAAAGHVQYVAQPFVQQQQQQQQQHGGAAVHHQQQAFAQRKGSHYMPSGGPLESSSTANSVARSSSASAAPVLKSGIHGRYESPMRLRTSSAVGAPVMMAQNAAQSVAPAPAAAPTAAPVPQGRAIVERKKKTSAKKKTTRKSPTKRGLKKTGAATAPRKSVSPIHMAATRSQSPPADVTPVDFDNVAVDEALEDDSAALEAAEAASRVLAQLSSERKAVATTEVVAPTVVAAVPMPAPVSGGKSQPRKHAPIEKKSSASRAGPIVPPLRLSERTTASFAAKTTPREGSVRGASPSRRESVGGARAASPARRDPTSSGGVRGRSPSRRASISGPRSRSPSLTNSVSRRESGSLSARSYERPTAASRGQSGPAANAPDPEATSVKGYARGTVASRQAKAKKTSSSSSISSVASSSKRPMSARGPRSKADAAEARRPMSARGGASSTRSTSVERTRRSSSKTSSTSSSSGSKSAQEKALESHVAMLEMKLEKLLASQAKKDEALRAKHDETVSMARELKELKTRSATSGISEPVFREIAFHAIDMQGRIGKGGYGEVFRAQWQGNDVAVKVFADIGAAMSQETLDEFKGEVSILSKMRHPNIVLMMGACTQPGKLAIVTEYLEGGSLFDVLHRRRMVLTEEQRVRVCKDVAKAVNYLHHFEPQVIHRDLKSSNILLDEYGNAKICDFGTSRTMSASLAMTGSIGTANWTAPEVLRNESYDEKADVSSFGLVVWEMMTNQVPHHDMSAIQIAGNVVGRRNFRPPMGANMEPAWEHLIRWCWNEDARRRPSFDEVLNYLNVYL